MQGLIQGQDCDAVHVVDAERLERLAGDAGFAHVVVVGEGEQYGRVAGWCQWVGLLPVIDAVGADFICSPHDAGGDSALLIPVNSLNCVSFTRQAVTAVATIRGETIPQGVALLIVYTFKPFKFRVYVVVHVVVVG